MVGADEDRLNEQKIKDEYRKQQESKLKKQKRESEFFRLEQSR
jgi:hypothetical protein